MSRIIIVICKNIWKWGIQVNNFLWRGSLVVSKKLILVLIAWCFIITSQTASAKIDEMILVEGGEFIRGDQSSDLPYDKPSHRARVSTFFISKYEVTFADYDVYCDEIGLLKPIDDKNGSRGQNPVMHVSWYDAIKYCNWKSVKEGLTPCYTINGTNVICNFAANGYRLPTGAEWEYAARGGNKSQRYIYSGSNNADEVAWYWNNSEGRTHPVGLKKPNELGLYDMSGNDWEWCWDLYGGTQYYIDCVKQGIVDNPKGPDSNTSGYRTTYGGGCNTFANKVLPSVRGSLEPSYTIGGGIGFRLARSK